MEEPMPMEDALAVWADEGRVVERENNDESLTRRYQLLVSEWSNPNRSNTADSDFLSEG